MCPLWYTSHSFCPHPTPQLPSFSHPMTRHSHQPLMRIRSVLVLYGYSVRVCVLRVCKVCRLCASLERRGGRVREAGKREREQEEGKKNLFVSYGNTRRQTQALINYTLHLHIPGIRHYANSEVICIMDSSCCLSCLMPPFYLIMKEKKNKRVRKKEECRIETQ